MTTRPVIYLVPDLTGLRGGIARYCRMVTLALTSARVPLTAVALNDTPGQVGVAVPPEVNYRPCRGHRALFVLQACLALFRRPRLILLGHPNFSVLGLILARLSQSRLVVFMYGIDVWTPLPPLRRWALQRADGWITISNFTARRAAAANDLPLDRLRILYNCLDPTLAPDAAAPPTPEPRSLLSVSRISTAEPTKGHAYVIEALPGILARFPDAVYHIVGDGDGRPALERLVRERGLSQNVRFHGLVSEDELIRRYQACELFILPSRLEGFGFVFLEALAYGKPVIAGREDAAVEVIQDGETGRLVNPRDAAEIADAVIHLFDHVQQAREMGERGRGRARTMFTFERFCTSLVNYLQEHINADTAQGDSESQDMRAPA